MNYISDVFDYTLELRQQDVENALRAPKLSLLVIHESRNEWDPGIHEVLSSTPNRDIVGFLQTSILPRSGIFILNDVVAVRIQFGISKRCVPQQCYCSVPSRLLNHVLQLPWDPGDATIAMACEQAATCWRMVWMEEDQKETELFAKLLHMASENAFIEQSTMLRHPSDPELHIDWVLRIASGNHIKELSVGDSSLAIQQAQLHQFRNQQWHMMLTTEGIKDWDPGIGAPSSMYLRLQGLTARIATEKSLSWLPIPELTKWQSQVASASFVWDPDTMLLWYKPKWWLLFIEEKISGHNL